MKNKIAGIIALSIILITSCKKEMVCTQGYSGSDCTTQITPTKIKISQIKIVKFPQYDNGSDWDFLTNTQPDIYFSLMQGNNIVFEQPTYYENAVTTDNHVYSPATDIEITAVTSEYAIRLYDYDSGSDDDYMGGISFYIYDGANDFPETRTIDAGGDMAFELSLSYMW